MKKIKLTALLGAAALAVLSFGGCTTGNSDLEVALKPSYLVGGFTAAESPDGYVDVSTNRFLPLSYTDGVASYTWTYKTSNEAWGNSVGTETFKVTLGAGWSVQWGDATLTLNGDYQELTEGSNPDNISVSGLVDGNSYTVYIKASGATISAKIAGTAAASYYVVQDNALNEMTVASTTSYTYTFTTGSSDTSTSFTIFDSSDTWSTGSELTVGDDGVAMTKGTTANMTATVSASTKYEITVDAATATAPTVKIEKVILTPGYICGDFTGWSAESLTYTDPVDNARTATYTFTATSTEHQFGVIADTGWATKYTAATITPGGGYEECTLGGSSNNTATGLSIGTGYTITIKGTADSVSIKIDAAE